VFSGLDLALRSQISGLLEALKERWALTYVLISHDLELVRRMADEFAVLHNGRIVDQGSINRILLAAGITHARNLAAAASSPFRG
jgi:ABC-type microcin C transport system duplicated ATPase subunit YejF